MMRFVIIVLCAICGLVGCHKTKEATSVVESETYHQDIAPMFVQSCISCHAEGKVAFPLTTRSDLVKHEGAILSAVKARRMPIWLAEPGHRVYADDPSLSSQQIEMIERWYQAGAPSGPKPELGADLGHDLNWQPDYSVELFPNGGGYLPNQDKNDDYRCFVVDWPSDKPREFITGFQAIPGNEAIVHHLVAFRVDEGIVPLLEKVDDMEPDPGYQCFGGAYPDRLGQADVQEKLKQEFPDAYRQIASADMWLFHWAPGIDVTYLPKDVGIPMRASDKLVIQVHYYSGFAKGEIDSGTSIHFVTEDDVAKPGFVFGLSNNAWLRGPGRTEMVIPPGEEETFEVTKSLEVVAKRATKIFGDVSSYSGLELLSSNIHMHSFGAASDTTLILPDGTKETLLAITDWDLHWQRDYFFKDALVIPKEDIAATAFQIRCTYANPTKNNVYGGLGSDEEMCFNFALFALRR